MVITLVNTLLSTESGSHFSAAHDDHTDLWWRRLSPWTLCRRRDRI